MLERLLLIALLQIACNYLVVRGGAPDTRWLILLCALLAVLIYVPGEVAVPQSSINNAELAHQCGLPVIGNMVLVILIGFPMVLIIHFFSWIITYDRLQEESMDS
ncbi:MAG: hypothetical protein AAF433_22010 [Bacteroidota bacterium]